jgi:hypothetical protein
VLRQPVFAEVSFAVRVLLRLIPAHFFASLSLAVASIVGVGEGSPDAMKTCPRCGFHHADIDHRCVRCGGLLDPVGPIDPLADPSRVTG